jgi:hypothetical protein
VDPAYLARVAGVQSRIDKADRLNKQVLAELTKLGDEAGTDLEREKAEELRELFRRAGALLRGARPESLCLYCKGERVTCMSCGDKRYATASQMAVTHPEVLKCGGEAACVAIAGQPPVLLTEWRKRTKNGEAAHGG